MKLNHPNTTPRAASAWLLSGGCRCLADQADYSTAVLSHNPVAYWQFQETAA